MPAKNSTSEKPAGNLESIRCQDLLGGASFGHFRLSSDEPRKNLTTVADRVASRLVGYLGHEDAPWDMLATIGYTKHLPIRLAESPALRDGVALMCSAWANYRRNLPAAEVIDSNLYGKALRSLQRALNDAQQQLSCETLAAATILGRLEILFDTRRPFNRTHHAEGIKTIMLKRGPPKIDDDLDLHLALENHAAMISLWIVEEGENFYLTSPWKEVMLQSGAVLEKTLPSERLDCYKIGYYFGFWPGLAHKFRRVSNDPDIDSQREQALALRDEVANLDAAAQIVSEPIFRRARREGRILELLDSDTPVAEKFHFGSLDTMSFVVSYLMIRMVFNRILYHTMVLLGQPDMLLEVEHRDLCRQTWMCMPFIKNLGLMASVSASTPVFLSYEGAGEAEREYVMDIIIEVASYKGRYPKERHMVELLVLNTVRAMTGRGPFVPPSSSAGTEGE
ncbi:hypothetical protein F4677DRAFT_254126 [Hypoxylon crocopeplum]|nr:hypothetical protein F4677DRAFT_254126 [Hypoxylon crocopeplum]